MISAPDAAFLPKRGKQTFGRGHCFNSCTGRADRGLELSTLAVGEVTHRCACTLAVAQVIAQLQALASRIAAVETDATPMSPVLTHAESQTQQRSRA
jgi:hypothetical protein